ncbi:unnamed protein product [marine sediment metagenome]|uniref:DUF4124 domain-containing protein n=1 Tax=marine sediment metagenome TaxID=412755 RepID=X1C2P3_9ZZZZ
MRTILIILLLIPLYASAEIYHWRDGNGVEHFSDQPHRGAERVKLPAAQTYTPVILPQKVTEEEQVPVDPKQQQYEEVKLVAPIPEQTFRNNIGLVDVIVALSPSLAVGDKVVLYVNGLVAGESEKSTRFTLQNVNRGTHSVQVKVLNPKGVVVGASKRVIFYMQRPRVNMVKPAVPPPKPKPYTPNI